MISVEEARRMILEHVVGTEPDPVPLREALQAFAAADVVAPYDHPLFDVSAVDGYAFAFDDEQTMWKLVGSVAAGEVFTGNISPGECVRIFTGAAVPSQLDTVVMQEFVTGTNGSITHSDAKLKRGANVRLRAEQVKAGEVILQKGDRITPVAVGLLASVGVRSVPVWSAPEVAVLVTGNEFNTADRLLPGRIFSSNDVMLETALRSSGCLAEVEHVEDDLGRLTDAILQAARLNEVIITTGGASVGDHDLVHEAVLRAGGTIHFHGVAQKPGKPMLFATVQGKPFFGLPGNPRAVMILFWEYVLPYLRAMQGAHEPWLRCSELPVDDVITVKGDRAEFRAARVVNGRVKLLSDEGSHMLRSLVLANALVYLPVHQRTWKAGGLVEIHHLDHEAATFHP